MKTIINNQYDLKDSSVTEVVKRVKVLLTNSNDEILLEDLHTNYPLFDVYKSIKNDYKNSDLFQYL